MGSPTKGPPAEDPDDNRANAVDAGTAGLEGTGDVADSGGCDTGCGDCDGPDCGCDFLLFVRLSTVLLLVAALVPAVGADRPMCALIRGYQRWLSRFTPGCPGSPSCSAYALTAVHRLGARRACWPPPAGSSAAAAADPSHDRRQRAPRHPTPA